MILTTVAKVRARRSTYPDGVEVDDAIKSALEGTTEYLESVFDTDFERLARKDIFFIDPRVDPRIGDLYKFRLSNGFVDPATVVVKTSGTFQGLVDASPSVVNEDFEIQEQQGKILLFDSSLKGIVRSRRPSHEPFYVQVEYTKGFNVDGMDPDLYDPSDVPSWLRELAVNYAIITLTSQTPVRRFSELDVTTQAIISHTKAIISKRRRTLAGAKKPVDEQ